MLNYINLYPNFIYLLTRHYLMISSQSKNVIIYAEEFSQFILNRYRNSPSHLKFILLTLTIFFYIHCFFIFFLSFSDTSTQMKCKLIKTWKYSQIKPLRDFIKFHETLFDLYSLSNLNHSID